MKWQAMTAPAVPSSAFAEDGAKVRPLLAADLPDLRRLIEADPIAHCFVASRLLETGRRMGAEFWAVERGGRCVSALHVGANVIPIATDTGGRRALAERLRRTGRRGSSLVGPAAEVLDLWERIAGVWGPVREVRAHQPVLAMDTDPVTDADPQVRQVRMDEIDILLPACVAMFTEEVGVSPVSGGAGPAYRSRIADLVRAGRAFARIESGRVVFKAEVGAASADVCQVQGVWVSPDLRGRGLSVPGMSAVVTMARRHIAPVVSLYVNDFNIPARRCYEAVGMRHSGEFATILL
jgi:uncharacterized protein